jgi:fermentation-respiration switch protein FrsA (DUF1100 family)
MKQKLARAAFSSLVFVLGFAVAVPLIEDTFIYHPSKGGVAKSPGEEVDLVAKDGTKLHGWFVTHAKARATLLWFHGNAGNIEDYRSLVLSLRDLPANVLIVDFRGYGMSDGSPSEQGFYQDARAAYDWALGRAKPERIVVLGESLGGGSACELATQVPLGGLILQATFTSTPDMSSRVLPWLPGRFFMRSRYDNLSKVARISCPKLFLQARDDGVIPFSMGETLLAAAAEPKDHVWFDRGGHNGLAHFEGPRYFAALRAFLDRVAPPP